MKISVLTQTDYPAVSQIFLEGIETRQATFETESPTWTDWDKGHLWHSRILATDNNIVAGWVALSSVSNRRVFAGVAEVSIYISEGYRGKGVGDLLLKEVIKCSEANGIWTLQSGIFPENIASVRLHEKHGFRLLCTREKIGKMAGAWRDIVFLERRSVVAGTL